MRSIIICTGHGVGYGYGYGSVSPEPSLCADNDIAGEASDLGMQGPFFIFMFL
jgi:hypothetical protein